MTQRMRIAVLMGGISNEREVSLRSGSAIAAALTSRGYAVTSVDVQGEDLRAFLDPGAFDMAFIALHGRFGEDGNVQRQCETMGLAYTGSRPRASALALDKVLAKEAFLAHGIQTPAYVVLQYQYNRKQGLEVLEGLCLPVVVKPPLEGSSIGLTIVRDPPALGQALELAFQYGRQVLVEEFIPGRELTVGILGEEALPVIQIVPNQGVYDYHAKYTPGQTQYLVPAPLNPDIAQKAQTLGLQAFRALDCEDFGRVDVMLDANGNCHVLEVNTIPGFTQTSLLPKAARAMGWTFEDLCERILSLSLKKELAAKK